MSIINSHQGRFRILLGFGLGGLLLGLLGLFLPALRFLRRLPKRARDAGAEKDALAKDCGGPSPTLRPSARVCQLFLNITPLQIEQISAVVAERSAAELRAHAHKFKGTCAAIGALELADCAHALEQMAVRGDLGEADARLDALLVEFRKVHDSLGKELRSGST